MPYLTTDEYKSRADIPSSYVDSIEAEQPGWTDLKLEAISAWIDARLRKRYAAPFTAPYPIAVLGWLTSLVTLRVMIKRGVNPLDEQFVEIRDDATNAREEIKEAADSVDGLFDLPLRADTTKSGISKGGPLAYSEASPYVWANEQRRRARDEDRHRRGTRG